MPGQCEPAKLTVAMVYRMGKIVKETTRRVLIASANPLFGKGLQNMFQRRWGNAARVVGLTSTTESTLRAVDELQPDLVILDYDDQSINRDEFLNYYVSGKRPMQVALVSLNETGSIIVYDRRSLTPTQAEIWLGAAWLNSLFTEPPAAGRQNDQTNPPGHPEQK